MAKSKQPPLSDPTRTPATSQGMPAKDPREPSAGQPGRQITPKDASAEASLELPSDRDQSSAMTAAELDPKVQQAATDLKRGLSDTSKGAETDKAYQKQK
jgi:hypothetical protein